MNIYTKELLNHFSSRSWMFKKILDLGCGVNPISLDLAKLGADVTVSDARQQIVNTIVRTNKYIKGVRADLDIEWPFANKKYDFILLFDILSHLKNPEKVINNCLKIANNIIIETDVVDSDQFVISNIDEQKNIDILSYNGVGSRFSKIYLDSLISKPFTSIKQIKSSSLNTNNKIYDWNFNFPENAFKKRIFYIITVDSKKSKEYIKLPQPTLSLQKINEITTKQHDIEIVKTKIDITNAIKKDKPKIALCLSGNLRTYQKTFRSLYDFIIGLNDIDVFIHTWETLGTGTSWHNTDKDGQHVLIKDNIREINAIYKPKGLLIENNKEKIKADGHSFDIVNVSSMYYGIFKSNELKLKYENANKFKYNLVIRCRPDLLFRRPIIFDNLDLNFINIPKHGNFTGLCDQFAISSSENMDLYSSLYLTFDKYKRGDGWLVGRPEDILKKHLESINMQWKHEQFDFDILRLNNAVQNNLKLERRLGMK